MYHPTQLPNSKPVVNNPISRPPLRRGFLLIPLALALAWLALSPAAQAVTPAPDGGYPNFTTAEGDNALFNLTTGTNNTAIGFHALFTTTTGISNTATGESALFGNTTGDFNTATGDVALFSNTTGGQNTAYGDGALFFNTTGNNNIALGVLAGTNLTTGDDNIDIGNGGVAGDSGKIRIGTKTVQKRAFIAGISGSAVTGSAVVVDTSGQLGVAPSSARFKDAIKPMDKASEAILELKPVTFRYKHELDPAGIPQFGLVAEQVEKVNPALVARDADGKVYTVRYEAVNAMLLNEFLKEHRKVGELEATAAQQQKEIKALTASLKEQAAQIQKVSDKVEMSRPTPQMVSSNQ
jgi:Chaperone of endosialidase